MRPPDHFRAHARLSTDLWVLVRHNKKRWQRDARIVDLGLGGACIEVSESLEPGAEIAVEFRAQNLWDPLVLLGHVAWIRYGMRVLRAGIRFDHREPSKVFALLELLVGQPKDS